jgi:replicative DNA helicase
VATVEQEKTSRNESKLTAYRRDADDLFDRQPPRSIEAERAVIGSLLLLPEAADEVALIVRAEDFYDEAHRRIFAHLQALHDDGQKIDLTLLYQRLKDHGEYESVGGAAYLLEVAQQVTTAAHAEHYACIVRDKAILRSLIHTGTDIVNEAYETAVDAREVLAKVEERIFRILDSKGEAEIQPLREVLHDSLARIDSRLQHKHTYHGLETGFYNFDDLTGGLQNSELIILAARPSMGKTALALNIVEHVAIDERGPGKPVLIVSLEMSSIELADRLLCSRAEVNSRRLRTGHITQEETSKLIAAAAEMSRAPLFIDESPSRNMTEIAAAARRLKRQENLALIVVDYLQLIEPDNSRDPRQEQVARIARRLKGLARELDIPVLCLAQLNRQAEGIGGHKPQLSHLRESGAIEQDADVVMFIHRDEMTATSEEDRQRLKGDADLLLKKNRNGPTRDFKLVWRDKVTRFENAARFEEFDDFEPSAKG